MAGKTEYLARYLGMLLLATLLGGCASVQINTDYDQDADFARYATFTWIGEDKRPLHQLERKGAATNSLVQKRLRRATAEALSAKGFAEVSRRAQADLLVAFHVSVRHEVDVTDLPYRRPHRWVYKTHVNYYDVGTLVIDLIDRRQHQLVWRGTATKVMTENNLTRREHLDRIVAQILANFPPY